MTGESDEIWDDLFLGCALAAWLDQAAAEGGWPSSEGTRRRAYRYYEDALASRPAPVECAIALTPEETDA